MLPPSKYHSPMPSSLPASSLMPACRGCLRPCRVRRAPWSHRNRAPHIPVAVRATRIRPPSLGRMSPRASPYRFRAAAFKPCGIIFLVIGQSAPRTKRTAAVSFILRRFTQTHEGPAPTTTRRKISFRSEGSPGFIISTCLIERRGDPRHRKRKAQSHLVEMTSKLPRTDMIRVPCGSHLGRIARQDQSRFLLVFKRCQLTLAPRFACRFPSP